MSATAAMSRDPMLHRRYRRREEAVEYLLSRGFRCSFAGWRNGLWEALIETGGDGFHVTIWLGQQGAA